MYLWSSISMRLVRLSYFLAMEQCFLSQYFSISEQVPFLYTILWLANHIEQYLTHARKKKTLILVHQLLIVRYSGIFTGSILMTALCTNWSQNFRKNILFLNLDPWFSELKQNKLHASCRNQLAKPDEINKAAIYSSRQLAQPDQINKAAIYSSRQLAQPDQINKAHQGSYRTWKTTGLIDKKHAANINIWITCCRHRIKTAAARRFSVEEQREQSKQTAQKQSFRELQVQK